MSLTIEQRLDLLTLQLAALQAQLKERDKAPEKPIEALIVDVVAKDLSINPGLVLGQTRQGRIPWARQIAQWLLKTELGWSSSQVAGLFGCDISNPTHAMKVVELAIETKDQERVKELVRIQKKVRKLIHESRQAD